MVVSFKTLGCRLNQAETAAFAGGLETFGFTLSDREDAPCDVHVVHTCAITHAAEVEALRAVRHARRALGPGTLLVAAGCAVELPGAEDAFRDAGADIVVRRADKSRLPELVAAALGLPTAAGVSAPVRPRFSTTRAILKVQDGCACRCAYCIVPSTRGAPQSRPFSDAIAEADAVFRAGYREIVLTGVNLALYHDAGHSLRDLCTALLALGSRRGARLRFGSIEPVGGVYGLLDLAAANGDVCPFFHFPLQSGSDRILQAMRRPYSAAAYERLTEKTLEALPYACLGADIITGFPGEDDAAFAETVRLVERIPFGNLHVFPYSERPGTPAAAFPDSVPMHVRRQRARELVALGEAKRAAFARQFVGRDVAMLVERVASDGTGTGWSGEYLPCRLPGCTAADVNTLKTLRVSTASGDTLLCETARP